MTLEISAKSPSDSQHWFKNCYFGTENDEDEDVIFKSGNHLREATARLHDPKHGWIDGQQVAAPDESAVLRLFEEVDLNFKGELPRVHAITSLVLRRQCRRRFAPRTLGFLFDKLPRLECIVYEPWQVFDRIWQEVYDKEYKMMIEAHLPKGLKSISLFEDYNEDYIALFQGASIFQVDPVRISKSVVSEAFAQRSLNLEQLSVSFTVDAQQFLEARRPLWTWDHLQSLVLTSQLLNHGANREGISDLLRDAGAAALCMPKLQFMAVCNCGEGDACVFIYRKECNSSSIIWRGIWDLKLEPRVIQAWQEVAIKYTPYELRVKKEQLRGGTVTSHGEAIHQLDLPRGVLDPVSLCQIRREGKGWKRT
ncbi:hypothetical protein B0J14DRAFT_210286 [Halenospora varia]|nr:hypothetical protein B0J14DRAFT_210286 [Halenospora varia]